MSSAYRIADLPFHITKSEIRRLAVESDSDPRTVLKVLAGGRARGMVDARIRRVLDRRGISVADRSSAA